MKKNKILIIVIISIVSLLFLIGLLSIGIAYLLKSNKETPIETEEKETIKTDNNDEITRFANKYYYDIETVQTINKTADMRDDGDFELDYSNLKEVTDNIVYYLHIVYANGTMALYYDYKTGTNCQEDILYTEIISSTGIDNKQDSFHLGAPNCFNKDYLQKQADKYLANKTDIRTCSIKNETSSTDKYICSTGLGNFGGKRPTYLNTETWDDGSITINYIYKEERLEEDNSNYLIKFFFKREKSNYKLDTVNLTHVSSN